MFENIKSDLIYYKSNTDFELEFNLSGCCKMRLLTAKAPDKKTFVHSLARAVSRSNIVLVIGSLFSEEGIISITAKAIGSSLVVINNQDYGIDNDQTIEVIKDSLPLVTPEGYFGGCIIESGPQSIILLTENKNIRKTIMNELIHPYIKELYLEANSTSAKSEETAEETIVEEAVETPAEEAVEEPVENENNEEETTATEETETIDEAETVEQVAEPEIVEENKIAESAEETTAPIILNLASDDVSDENKTEEVEEDKGIVSEDISKKETKKEIFNENEDEFFFFTGANSDEAVEEIPPIPTSYTCYEPKKRGLFGILPEKEPESVFSFDAEETVEEITETVEETPEELIEETPKKKEKKKKEKKVKEPKVKKVKKVKSEEIEESTDLEDKKPTKKKNGSKVFMIILMVIILLAIAVLGYFLFYLPYKNGTSVSTDLQEIINTLLG